MSGDHHGPDDIVGAINDAFDADLEPIPPRLLDAAHAAFEWRRVDAELAEVLFDSAEQDLVGVRGTTSDRRSFRYAAADFVLRVHLTPDNLIMMIEPPLSVPCRVSTEVDTTEFRTDDLGEVVVERPHLPLRIEVDLPSGPIVTPWITG